MNIYQAIHNWTHTTLSAIQLYLHPYLDTGRLSTKCTDTNDWKIYKHKSFIFAYPFKHMFKRNMLSSLPWFPMTDHLLLSSSIPPTLFSFILISLFFHSCFTLVSAMCFKLVLKLWFILNLNKTRLKKELYRKRLIMANQDNALAFFS